MERDFLQLTETGSQLKRQAENEEKGENNRGKKPKTETLNLGLSLGSSNPASSDDCGASRSYSHFSNPFSHNPSCSLTRNSTDNLDFSRETDQIWYAGEGTNGSVHSRFKPVGLESTAGNVNFSHHNSSFFPLELPAKPREDLKSSSGALKSSVLPTHDAILKQIVLEPVQSVAQKLNELPGDYVEGLRVYVKNVLSLPEKKDELGSLRRKLERRVDLTPAVLSKANGFQLETMVAIKTCQPVFILSNTRFPVSELVEIFLRTRCKNVNCRSVIPVDDCDCKLCSSKKGFCSACTCTVCFSFDSALNTCSWVGCDVCCHWCHAICGLRKNLIRPGSGAGGVMGKTEMQFYCIGCGHVSEMYEFVKEVFVCCAKDWGVETLTKELDCVAKIFKGSEDFRGKELNAKAEELLRLLEKKVVSPSDACNSIVQLLKCEFSLRVFASWMNLSISLSGRSMFCGFPQIERKRENLNIWVC